MEVNFGIQFEYEKIWNEKNLLQGTVFEHNIQEFLGNIV